MSNLVLSIALGIGFVLLTDLRSAHAVENAIFGYTHLLPSPYTLPKGKFVIGTTTAVGLTDFFEIQTDIFYDFYRIYNVRAKLGFLDFPGFAGGFYVGYQYLNLNDLSSTFPSVGIGAFTPGGTIGVEILPDVALFLGGHLYYPNTDPTPYVNGPSGYLPGSEFGADLSWAYFKSRNKTSGVYILSFGATYNNTYGFYGVGISHHWRGLHLGVHYYPNVSRLRFQPILAGGAQFDF